ncbi:UNVERIFIED_CONTAM: hypothetical protein FKN15_021795 [Acipenser sinensis]
MTMDYSRLHTYTPPQCVPENTGYTYSLSSSYSSTALDFENKHKLHPVFKSPKMSRRSLRLTTGHYSDDSYLDTNNSSISYSGKYKESRMLTNPQSRKQTSYATAMMANGDITSAETQTTVINGYTCNECTMLSDRKDALTAYCTSNTASSTAEYSRDKGKKSSIFHLFREQFLSTSKHAVAFIASLIMQLVQNVLLKIGSEEKGICDTLVYTSLTLAGSLNALHSLKWNMHWFKALNQWCWWLLGTILNCTASLLFSLGGLRQGSFRGLVVAGDWMVPTYYIDVPPQCVCPNKSGAHFFDSGRMVDLERQLALLSDRCDRSSQQYDERHGRVVELFHQLQEQVAQMSNNEGMSAWISNLFNQHMSSTRELRGEGTGQPQNEFLMLHQGHESRILELEKLLQIIAAKTENHIQSFCTSCISGQSEDQSYLLSEVKRLELELHQIKTDLLRVQSSPPGCEGLASVRETVDTQVKESVKLLIFGNKDEEMSESLLQWLSTQFVRQSDLQGLLMEMEMKILKNITMYKSKTKLMPTAEVVTHAVHNAGAAGMTEEQVRVIVTNALRLYSQDQTGLVDYALESGGGSILSTRCSETYETKTALMSLFGIPLWYFSQSPRVIIQPDVHPGNCWAFKGSQGYLVIRLSLSVYPTSFSLEHIPKSLSPTGSINSAPKDFTVYGLEDEYQEEGKLLGRYIYNEDGDSLQTFPIQEENDKAYQIIEMRVLSNWGHPEYTCLYRFRVHGEPRLE